MRMTFFDGNSSRDGGVANVRTATVVVGNVNLALVLQALGHRSITSTMQYVGTSDGQAAEASQAALMKIF
jgi:hypothetical protein